MKYALLGDIHANLDALEAVLKDAESQGVTNYACLGDIVGYNANPVECLTKIRELCPVSVRGNHDHYCSHNENLDNFHPLAADVVAWTRQQLTDEQVQFFGISVMSHALKHSRLFTARWIHRNRGAMFLTSLRRKPISATRHQRSFFRPHACAAGV